MKARLETTVGRMILLIAHNMRVCAFCPKFGRTAFLFQLLINGLHGVKNTFRMRSECKRLLVLAVAIVVIKGEMAGSWPSIMLIRVCASATVKGISIRHKLLQVQREILRFLLPHWDCLHQSGVHLILLAHFPESLLPPDWLFKLVILK